MSPIEVLSQAINAQAELLSKAWQEASVHDSPSSSLPPKITVPKLDAVGEEARNQLLTNLRQLEQLVLGPKDAMQSLYYKVCLSSSILQLVSKSLPRAPKQE